MNLWSIFGKVFSVGGRSAWGLLGKIFGKSLFYVSMTTFVLLILLWQPLVESFQTRDPMPFISEAGGLAFGIDYKLEQKTRFVIEESYLDEIEQYNEEQMGQLNFYQKAMYWLDTYWSMIYAYLSLLGTLYIYGVLFKFLYSIWKALPLSNNSEVGRNLLFAVITLIVLQLVYFAVIFGEVRWPLMGVWYFISHVHIILGQLQNFLDLDYYRARLMVNATEINATNMTGVIQI